jgi:hypothetical protein
MIVLGSSWVISVAVSGAVSGVAPLLTIPAYVSSIGIRWVMPQREASSVAASANSGD